MEQNTGKSDFFCMISTTFQQKLGSEGRVAIFCSKTLQVNL